MVSLTFKNSEHLFVFEKHRFSCSMAVMNYRSLRSYRTQCLVCLSLPFKLTENSVCSMSIVLPDVDHAPFPVPLKEGEHPQPLWSG